MHPYPWERHPVEYSLRFVEAAIELGSYLRGVSTDFSSLNEVAGVINLRLRERPKRHDFLEFPPTSPWDYCVSRALGNPGREILRESELLLQLHLLHREISGLRRLPEERLKNLRSFFTDASSEFSSYSMWQSTRHDHSYRLAG